MKLAGKNIVVTGGSRGIGAGIAKRLAREGASVAITYTSRPDSAEKVLSELNQIRAQLKGADEVATVPHMMIQMDVSDESSIESAFAKIFESFGKVDGLVNNAGITRDQLLLRMKSTDFDDVMKTNLRGAFLCTQAVTKPMLKARNGSIVNITSVIGHSGNSGQANYAASKAGITAFTKSVAQEIGSRGIRLNCVAPGFITTEMTDVLPEAQKNAILAKVPLQRFGDVEDVAAAVAFLLSDDAKFITGHTLHVNGGMFMD